MISIFTFVTTLAVFVAITIVLLRVRITAQKNVINKYEEEIKKLHEELGATEKQAITDELTGIYNRRGFMMRLNEELNRTIHYDIHRSACLVYMDIDGLKIVNDTYGHDIGDFFLKEFVKIVKENARASDIVARLGGDEFAILIPEHTPEFYIIGVFNLIDRLKEKIKIKADSMFLPSNLTGVSAGVEIIDLNNFDPKKDNLNKKIEEIIHSADQKMYKDKGERKRAQKAGA